MVLEDEELLLEGILGLHAVLVLDSLLPHSHELPSFKFLKEWKLLDVVVGVTLDQPLSKR